MPQQTVSLKLNQKEQKSLEQVLLKAGWFFDPIANEYVALRMKNDDGSVCTLYTSGKVVFQGNEDFTYIVNSVQGETENSKDSVVVPHIGVDEVGKGDYFGPLVVVSCFVDEKFSEKVKKLGVGDSKKFSDRKIMSMYSEMRNYEYYYVSVVSPKEYNGLVKELKNVGILLAKEHSKVIEMALKDLKAKGITPKSVVIDQFSSRKDRVINELGELGRSIDFKQFHKGESDFAVASASVLARGVFLEKMSEMSREYGFDFPKGSSNVISEGREFVEKFGEKELEKVAKISFRTTKSVLNKSFI